MEAKDALIAAKNGLRDAKKELTKFRKSNKLKSGEEPEDAKLAKTLKKLTQAVEKAEAVVADAKDKVKESKPKRGFKTKYTYPMVTDEESGEEREMTAAEKKKFRAKARAEKKKAEKGEDQPKTGKEKKAGKAKKGKAKKGKAKKEATPEEDDD